VLALVAIVLLLTLAGAAVLLTSTETAIAAGFRDGVDAFYTADGAVERAIVDLTPVADWTALAATLPAAAEAPWRVLTTESAGRFVVDLWIRTEASAGMVTVQGRASGARGVQRTIQATVGRAGEGVRLLAWRERR
jgi:hypothetical protein